MKALREHTTGSVTLGVELAQLTAVERKRMARSLPEIPQVPRPRRRRRRRRHGQDEAPEQAPQQQAMSQLREIDESLLSAEERDYLEARRLAEEKVDLYRRLVRAALIVVPLLIFIPWAGAIAFFVFGIDLGRKAFRVLYEPRLRERLVREEVGRRVSQSVHRERRNLEGVHARSLEKLSASIAHEIRNPITAAKSLVQQMGEDPNGADNVEYARVALGELERVEKSISHLLRFAREEEVRMGELRMSDVLESAIETFRERSERVGIEITRHFDSDGIMEGDAEKLRRVFINLVGNAIDSLEEAGIDKPWVEVAMGENLAGTEVWVRVRDNGLGIDDQTREQIFNPFFTSKDAGTGLGLAITKKLVDAHAGTLELGDGLGSAPDEGIGAEFLVVFPKRQPTPGSRTGGRSR